jgi:signal peptidase
MSRAIRRILSASCVVLAALMLIPLPFGYQRYVITGGSMTGAFGPGSLVFDEVVPTRSLRVGDVITYLPPGSAPGARVTHRIVRITEDARGQRVFRTKGDANRTSDPRAFRLEKPTQARVAFHLPYVGYFYAALADVRMRLAVIGLPALLIALSTLIRLFGVPAQAPRAGTRASARSAG